MDLVPAEWMPAIWKTLGVTVVVVLAVLVFRLIRRALRALGNRRKLSEPVVAVLVLVARYGVVAISVLLVLQHLGVLKNVWATLAAVLTLVAVGFVALWSVLANVTCTLLLLIFQPFQIGDDIEIPEWSLKGRAVDLNLLFTTLREEDGSELEVPSNIFFQKVIRRRRGDLHLPLQEQIFNDTPAE